MNKKHLFLILIAVAIILLGFNLNKTESAVTRTPTPLTHQFTTVYYPVNKPGAQSSMEGKWETSQPMFGKPNTTANRTPVTLEMYRKALENGSASDMKVSIAADPSYYGRSYIIPEITYINNKGKKYTMENVPVYVHDTGGAFRVQKGDSPEVIAKKLRKFDVAADSSISDAQADALGKKAPTSQTKTIYNPADDKSNTPVTIPNQPKTQTNDPCAGGGGGAGCGGDTKGSGTSGSSPSSGSTISLSPSGSSSSSGGGGSGGNLWNETDRLCHKHQGPATAKQLKTAMSCNGGVKCTTISCGDDCVYCNCVPVEKCGVNGTLCNSPKSEGVAGYGYCEDGRLETAKATCKGDSNQCGPKAGCLNYICPLETKKNAIWDMTSKKCGCG